MEEIPCRMEYTAPGPYPEIRAEEKNWRYGQAMLSNMGSGTSEMSAVARYLYGSFVQSGYPEVADSLRHISIVEMRHLSIFSQLACQMGEEPRLWAPARTGRRYWSPEYLRYSHRLDRFLEQALEEERSAVLKYRQQASWIRDENIVANLCRIIEDEEVHIRVLTCLLESYCGGRTVPRRLPT